MLTKKQKKIIDGMLELVFANLHACSIADQKIALEAMLHPEQKFQALNKELIPFVIYVHRMFKDPCPPNFFATGVLDRIKNIFAVAKPIPKLEIYLKEVIESALQVLVLAKTPVAVGAMPSTAIHELPAAPSPTMVAILAAKEPVPAKVAEQKSKIKPYLLKCPLPTEKYQQVIQNLQQKEWLVNSRDIFERLLTVYISAIGQPERTFLDICQQWLRLNGRIAYFLHLLHSATLITADRSVFYLMMSYLSPFAKEQPLDGVSPESLSPQVTLFLQMLMNDCNEETRFQQLANDELRVLLDNFFQHYPQYHRCIKNSSLKCLWPDVVSVVKRGIENSVLARIKKDTWKHYPIKLEALSAMQELLLPALLKQLIAKSIQQLPAHQIFLIARWKQATSLEFHHRLVQWLFTQNALSPPNRDYEMPQVVHTLMTIMPEQLWQECVMQIKNRFDHNQNLEEKIISRTVGGAGSPPNFYYSSARASQQMLGTSVNDCLGVGSMLRGAAGSYHSTPSSLPPYRSTPMSSSPLVNGPFPLAAKKEEEPLAPSVVAQSPLAGLQRGWVLADKKPAGSEGAKAGAEAAKSAATVSAAVAAGATADVTPPVAVPEAKPAFAIHIVKHLLPRLVGRVSQSSKDDFVIYLLGQIYNANPAIQKIAIEALRIVNESIQEQDVTNNEDLKEVIEKELEKFQFSKMNDEAFFAVGVVFETGIVYSKLLSQQSIEKLVRYFIQCICHFKLKLIFEDLNRSAHCLQKILKLVSLKTQQYAFNALIPILDDHISSMNSIFFGLDALFASIAADFLQEFASATIDSKNQNKFYAIFSISWPYLLSLLLMPENKTVYEKLEMMIYELDRRETWKWRVTLYKALQVPGQIILEQLPVGQFLLGIINSIGDRSESVRNSDHHDIDDQFICKAIVLLMDQIPQSLNQTVMNYLIDTILRASSKQLRTDILNVIRDYIKRVTPTLYVNFLEKVLENYTDHDNDDIQDEILALIRLFYEALPIENQMECINQHLIHVRYGNEIEVNIAKAMIFKIPKEQLSGVLSALVSQLSLTNYSAVDGLCEFAYQMLMPIIPILNRNEQIMMFCNILKPKLTVTEYADSPYFIEVLVALHHSFTEESALELHMQSLDVVHLLREYKGVSFFYLQREARRQDFDEGQDPDQTARDTGILTPLSREP